MAGGYYDNNSISKPYWTPENRSNKFTAPYFKAQGDTRFLGLQSRGYVRIQDVVISYGLNQQWVKKLNINSMKVFLSMKNIATFTKWKGQDPELGIGFLPLGQQSDNPLSSTFTVGVNMSF